jgi:hypothetical protein
MEDSDLGRKSPDSVQPGNGNFQYVFTVPRYPLNVVYGLLLGLQALRSLAMRYDCLRISGL